MCYVLVGVLFLKLIKYSILLGACLITAVVPVEPILTAGAIALRLLIKSPTHTRGHCNRVTFSEQSEFSRLAELYKMPKSMQSSDKSCCTDILGGEKLYRC